MTINELNQIKNSYNSSKERITIGMASCGIAAGGKRIFNYLKKELKDKGINIDVVPVGCIGVCRLEPIVEIYKNNKRVSYINVDEEKIDRIINEHLLNGNLVKEYLIDEDTVSIIDSEFIKQQTRIVLNECGYINPEDINSYIEQNGYMALHKSLNMKQIEIIDIIKKSGLRGRGGAGFNTGKKWEFAYQSEGNTKYVCCNADEGDPGAFMDRAILEGNPHSVIESMAIAGYAIGSKKGYIYVRAEYPTAVDRLKIAISQAKEKHLLGNNIFDTDFSFDIEIRLGAGAFVCGEETALITSIEGNRGEPRVKPPYPAIKGLFGCPTLLNNVETYANVSKIILNGYEWFNKIGTKASSGTKVFALGGKINNTGLVEVPIGTKLSKIVYDIGGGIPNNKKYKAAQTGGPSGGCIPNDYIDIPMDYENLIEIGSMMGSGGLIIMDEDNCMVDIAKFFLDFTVGESCGKCIPCRVGNKQLYDLLTKITEGSATLEDLDLLEELCSYIRETSLCGLGQSAPNPVLSTLKYFKSEYIEHIENKKCFAHQCKNLISYKIIKNKCIGCGLCKRNCPASAIDGNIKEPHIIDKDRCIKCGLCYSNCKFNAIEKE